MKCALIGDAEQIRRVFGEDGMAKIAARTDLLDHVVRGDRVDEFLPSLRDTEALVSTWGMPCLTEAQLDAMPALRVVFYAAGDVRDFARPLVRRGIQVVSAWRANAVPVAEFALAQILLAGKGYFRNVREYRAGRTFGGCHQGPGNRDETVAVLGAGAIGRLLIGLLAPFDLGVVVFDPFLTESEAAALRVVKVTMEEAFARSLVVTNHLADHEETHGLITGRLLASMRQGATFVNTGRGRTVVADEFVEVMRDRPDLTALLDVTDPEPLPPDSPIWDLPNVLVSTHIAGSLGNELGRMAELCLEELDRYLRGEPLLHVISPASLRS
ncbi:MAG: hydroxyacid dehydrogenase [Fimbriimonadaceae bacterium]|nr:hydroxyacid dehydrogenase [Fimbriimonadaceae bacterium]